MNTQSDIDVPAVSLVDLKLPPFWPTNPEAWFIQVEAQFSPGRITAELSRYHHFISCLPPGTASEVRDLLLAPPTENAYKTLKDTLIRRLSSSQPERLRQLLSDTVFGDRTPTQLLRHMQILLGSGTSLDGTLMGEIFLQHLPNNVRMALATVDEKDLGTMAAITDTIMAAAPPSLAAMQLENASASYPNHLLELREEIARLADTVAALQASTSRPSKERPAITQQPRQRWCWYHRKHGDAARKCMCPVTIREMPDVSIEGGQCSDTDGKSPLSFLSYRP